MKLKFITSNYDQEEYQIGHRLAKRVYQRAWGTKSLSDDHSASVIAMLNSEVVGNLCIHLRNQKLPCENYFHFQNEIEKDVLVAELCSLAIAVETPKQVRNDILLGLISAVNTFGIVHNISKYYTIQRISLLSRLKVKLNYPFHQVDEAIPITAAQPNDSYWRNNQTPKLYSIDNTDPQTMKSSLQSIAFLNRRGCTWVDQTRKSNDFQKIIKVA
ncbi:hypothetical protein L4174_006325 [Photobacterium sp. CCB-ST2H9]|uniref:hypothetical protein n=1 Tax=unclassified Photobacterium TaxID=2628852 RepID=UPI002002BA4C|nr:hypothetical protein [Photobacterium sp. CCB-ST2H9]UTM58451.1 hypothetical protein L4174_006325 [Photobacterium sp. CCB-ST2H9]